MHGVVLVFHFVFFHLGYFDDLFVYFEPFLAPAGGFFLGYGEFFQGLFFRHAGRVKIVVGCYIRILRVAFPGAFEVFLELGT